MDAASSLRVKPSESTCGPAGKCLVNDNGTEWRETRQRMSLRKVTMWRCALWKGWRQTRAGCSWPSRGCSERSSGPSGCPGWSSLGI